MIETPHVTRVAAQLAAVIRMTIPPAQMRTVIGPESGPDESRWRTELNRPLLG